MSQMFSPFFLSLFYQALQKRQLHLFLLTQVSDLDFKPFEHTL